MRALAAVVAAGVAALTMAVTARVAGRIAAVGAGLLVATAGASPFIESFTLSGELLASLAACASMLAFVTHLRSGRREWLVAAGLLTGCAVMLKQSGFDAGAAAAVMPSVYQEEIEAEDAAYLALVEKGSWAQPEAAEGYFPEMTAFRVGGLEARLETLRRAAEACAMPIVASLNGSTPEGWTGFARDLERAGAAAIEVNLYRVPTDPRESGAEVEQRWVETVKTVCAAVSIPVSVKLGPWLSSPSHHAMQLIEAGARGLVLFNRFYEPDIDLATLKPKPSLELSTPYEIR